MNICIYLNRKTLVNCNYILSQSFQLLLFIFICLFPMPRNTGTDQIEYKTQKPRIYVQTVLPIRIKAFIGKRKRSGHLEKEADLEHRDESLGI